MKKNKSQATNTTLVFRKLNVYFSPKGKKYCFIKWKILIYFYSSKKLIEEFMKKSYPNM